MTTSTNPSTTNTVTAYLSSNAFAIACIAVILVALIGIAALIIAPGTSRTNDADQPMAISAASEITTPTTDIITS